MDIAMRIITNNDLSVQPLSYMEREVFYFLRNFRKRHEKILVPLTNIAARFEKTTRTIKRILKALVEKGFIHRLKGGRGKVSETKVTEKGWSLRGGSLRSKMSPHMSPQEHIYLRSISLKGSKISPYPKEPQPSGEGRGGSRASGTNPRALGCNPRAIRAQETVVENKQVVVPKRLGEGFLSSAKKVLAKINCTLREKVVNEFDAYAAKTEIRHPIAFLRYKIAQLSGAKSEEPVKADKIAVERLQKEVEAKALEMAKDELKRNGEVYPVQNPLEPISEFFTRVQAYGVREVQKYRLCLQELEIKHGLRKKFNEPITV